MGPLHRQPHQIAISLRLRQTGVDSRRAASRRNHRASRRAGHRNLADQALRSRPQPPNPFTEEIPESVLQELGALATSRLGKGILDSIAHPDLRQKIAKSRFYKYPFGILAPTVYGWSKMRRTQPDSVVVFNTLVPAICTATILVAGILCYLHPDSWRSALAFIGSALLILIGWNIAFRD